MTQILIDTQAVGSLIGRTFRGNRKTYAVARYTAYDGLEGGSRRGPGMQGKIISWKGV